MDTTKELEAKFPEIGPMVKRVRGLKRLECGCCEVKGQVKIRYDRCPEHNVGRETPLKKFSPYTFG